MRYIEECEKNIDGQMSFDTGEVEDGKLQRFLQSLMEMGCEIHLWTDGYVWTIEYIEKVRTEYNVQFVAIDTSSQWVETQTENK